MKIEESLQNKFWPPVGSFKQFDPTFENFVASGQSEQEQFLIGLRGDPDKHGEFIQTSLSMIYGYVFGYADSPCHLKTNDKLEIGLNIAKIVIEREMTDFWLKPMPVPKGLSQTQAVEYLRTFIESNTGIYHKFFDFVRDDMSRESMAEFLSLETIRNEVVDDEVAYIVIGLQGEMKRAMASNLWDECGNGKITGFHTYWLRRLLDRTNRYDSLPDYRDNSVPWFSKVTSNSFNAMATRPGYKYRAYGSFLITESWVNAHFQRIIAGLERTGLNHEDIAVYFTAHEKLDPFHTEDMLQAIMKQVPTLTQEEIDEVIRGAHIAASAGTIMYDESIRYFSNKQTLMG